MENTKYIAPNIFLGHGSPMNVIEKNDFNDNMRKLGESIDFSKIKAIVCISAHYQTDGINIDAQENPKTIYDFYGFPDVLYKMEYKAPGSPELAEKLNSLLSTFNPKVTTNWGLDHGAWNVLWHLVPNANVPVVMMSLDYNLSMIDHFELGKKLRKLREEGIMILTSGNVVHSFKGIQFKSGATPLKESINFEKYVVDKINQKDFEKLIKFETAIYEDAKFSVNSAEHYIPLLYTLGAAFENETPFIFSNEIVFSTLSMLSVSYGSKF